MSEKATKADVAEIVYNEGLSYSIQSYLKADNIEDPELAKAWHEAKTVMDKIELLIVKEYEVLGR